MKAAPKYYPVIPELVLGDVPEIKIPEIKIHYERKASQPFLGKINASSDAYDLLKSLYPQGELEIQEQFIILLLNRANKVLGYYRASKGGITSTVVDVRLILAVAIKTGATGLILSHNHPSGNTAPSQDDKNITSKIKTGAMYHDISLLDHIIVTRESYYSFADEGALHGLDLSGNEQNIKLPTNKIIKGDALKELQKLPDESIDCVITSPPYWQLRDYGWDGQWGLEKTYSEYLERLWSLMDEIKRVLKPKGTVWINLGDTYFGSGNDSYKNSDALSQGIRSVKAGTIAPTVSNTDKANDLKRKCQVLIPHRFAIGCIERGWIIRNDIVWAKPNSLPESIKDRFSKKHEYIFLLVKNADYYFDMDAIRDPHSLESFERSKYGTIVFGSDRESKKIRSGKGKKNGGTLKQIKLNPKGKNPGDVTDFWNVPTKHGASGHFAAYNAELITKPILAGCPDGGIILDPFCGTGVTGVRAIELGRKFIGIDGKTEYCDIARENIKNASPDLSGFSNNISNPSYLKLPQNKLDFIEKVIESIAKEEKYNKKSLEKIAASFGINDKTEVKESIELAIVRSAKNLAFDTINSTKQKFDNIVNLYNHQVNLSHRTSQSILLQQYSTPAPIGFLMGIFCDVQSFNSENGKYAFEPSAGNGLLTVAGYTNRFYVNEIDKLRNSHLKAQGYAEVSNKDASQNFEGLEKYFDAVLTNPPFGKAGVVKLFDGHPITTLEHLMAIRALNTMKDSGKAAIIIGNHTFYDEKDRVQSGAQRIFLNYLYSHYYVSDIIPIDGQKLYSRQGTSFNVRLILIDGRKMKPEGAAPLKDSYKDSVVKTFDELYERVMRPLQTSPKGRLLDTDLVPTPDEINNNMKNVDPELNLAFQKYWRFKAKNPDTIPLVAMGNSLYSFNKDAFDLYQIVGLNLNTFLQNKTPEPYVKFPIESLDTYLNKIIQKGRKVTFIEELKNPKDKKQNPNPFDEAFDELEKDIKSMKGEEDLGAPYQPASEGCIVLNTVVPDSMEYETKQALELIKREVGGNIDEFVRQRLGYASKMDLCKALSAEQTDAVAMAIYNIEAREQGMIIGDQTGIGKGRVAAAMIRYAVLQSHKPIFITEKPNLFSDIYRDLIAIGSGHLVPFIVNGRESKTDIKDENGTLLHQALAPAEQQSFFKDKRIPGNCNFVLATYTQFNSPDKKPEKPQFILAVSKGNILIMDESHNASGSSQTGEFLQKIVYNTKGVVFLSATFAKRPDNMPIYAMKTSISDANMSKEDLIFAINKGGVALQEVLASQLVKEGQMLRRERSFEGVEVNYITLDELETEHKAIADNITEILREIIGFQSTNIEQMIDELDDIAVAEGKQVDLREGTSQAGVDNLPYFSKVFQVINQMLFAIKADAVADRAIMRLKEGKKPIIAFASTMGSFIEQMENEKGLPVSDGDVINADFSEVLMRGLDGILRYTETSPEGDKIYKKFDLAEFSEPIRKEYLRMVSKIKEMSSGLCISPIDLIMQKIKAAGFSAAEVTGRKYEVQLNLKTGKGMVMSRNRINTNDAFRQFNNNEVDVLMINQSGSTGASAHAIVTKKVPATEVKQRVMIVLQAELNINTEVQKRGRINRTGQILSPIYDYVMSAIPAEKRLMMMLQKKLKSLDANTTSNQKQSTKILDVPDFLNKYGDKIVTQYLSDNLDINKLLGDPLGLADTSNEKGEILEDAAHKVSGRVAVLATKMQAEFYTEVSQSYIDYGEYLKQVGDYDLEVEAMNLETETVSSKVARMGKGGDSEFGTDSILEKVKANVLKKPFKRTELENILKEALGNKEAEQIQKEQVNDFEKFSEAQLQKDISVNEEYYAELIKNIPTEKKAQKIREKDGEKAYIEELKKREVELTEASTLQKTKLETQSKHRKQYLNSIFKFFYTGKNMLYPMGTFSDGDIKIKSIFIGFIVDKRKKNPYAPSNIRLRFALASSHKYIAMPASYTKDINAIMGVSHSVETPDLETSLDEWEADIKESDVSRNTRYIVTGNLLQAFADYKGKLVSYTTNTGETKKGILMPEYWDTSEELSDKVSVPVARAAKVIQSTTKGNGITTDNGTSIFNNGDSYKIIVPASRQRGGEVFLDSDILNLVANHNFEKTADKMVAVLPHKNISEFLNILQAKFNDSVKLQAYQFDLIKNEGTTSKQRNKIKLLSPEEVDQQEAIMIEMEFAMAELELDMEMMRMRKNKMAA